MRRLAAFFCLAIAVSLHAQDTPEAVVARYYDAYAANDLRRIAAELDPAARPALIGRLDRHFMTRCVIVHDWVVRPVAIENAKATVDADVRLTIWSAAPGDRPKLETRYLTFALARTDVWRIVSWSRREDLLVERVAKTFSLAERDALLAGAGALRTPRLAMALAQRGMVFINRAQTEHAADLVARGREIAEETGDDAALSTVLAGEGTLPMYRAQPDGLEAIRIIEESIAVAERSGDPDVLGRALGRLGTARRAQYVKYEPWYQDRVLEMADTIEDPSVVASAAQIRGALEGDVQNAGESFRYWLLALKYAEMSGSESSIANALRALAQSYRAQGATELAIRELERVRAFDEKSGPGRLSGLTALYLAGAYYEKGAIEQAEKLIDYGIELGDVTSMAYLLQLRSSILLDRGRMAEAEKAIEQAVAAARQDSGVYISSLSQLVGLRIRQHRYEDAIAAAREMRARAYVYPQAVQPIPLLSMAAALRMAGLHAEARACLDEMAPHVERSDGSMTVDPMMWSASATQALTGHLMERVALAMAMGDGGTALRYAERLKARALRALVGKQPAFALTGNDRDREAAVNERLVGLNRRMLRTSDKAEQTSVENAITAARAELQEIRAHAASENAKKIPTPATETDPFAARRDYAVIQYVVDSFGLNIIGITPGQGRRRIILARPATDPRDLKRRADELRALLERRDLRYDRAAREMYDLVLAPVAELIEPGRPLCIIPDRDLWRVPFHALVGPDGKYVAAVAPVFYAPSLAFADQAGTTIRKPLRTDAPALLAFANPELHQRSVAQYRTAFQGTPAGALPDAEVEVRKIARLYESERTRVYVGEEASEARLKTASGKYSVVHIATHAAIDPVSPLSSAMLLAPGSSAEDGVLEAREVLDLAIKTDLAVLSACSTAGRSRAAEGLVGLSWAFLAIGCPTTVVSEWNATSDATANLMVAFHRQLRAGVSAAEALRRAQMEMRREPAKRHPFYWAPFIVLGVQ